MIFVKFHKQFSVQIFQQIRISDPNDQSKIFICTIDMPLFEHLKMEQSLHVSFDEFVTHLSKILDACKKEELWVRCSVLFGSVFIKFIHSTFQQSGHIERPFTTYPSILWGTIVTQFGVPLPADSGRPTKRHYVSHKPIDWQISTTKRIAVGTGGTFGKYITSPGSANN